MALRLNTVARLHRLQCLLLVRRRPGHGIKNTTVRIQLSRHRRGKSPRTGIRSIASPSSTRPMTKSSLSRRAAKRTTPRRRGDQSRPSRLRRPQARTILPRSLRARNVVGDPRDQRPDILPGRRRRNRGAVRTVPVPVRSHRPTASLPPNPSPRPRRARPPERHAQT